MRAVNDHGFFSLLGNLPQIIEKRRRDRINSSLSELRRLVPTAFEKQVCVSMISTHPPMQAVFQNEKVWSNAMSFLSSSLQGVSRW